MSAYAFGVLAIVLVGLAVLAYKLRRLDNYAHQIQRTYFDHATRLESESGSAVAAGIARFAKAASSVADEAQRSGNSSLAHAFRRIAEELRDSPKKS